MTEDTHPIVELTDLQAEALLARAMRNTLILGLRWSPGAADWVGVAQRRNAPRGRAYLGCKHLGMATAGSRDQGQTRQPENPQKRPRSRRVLCAQAHHLCRGHLW